MENWETKVKLRNKGKTDLAVAVYENNWDGFEDNMNVIRLFYNDVVEIDNNLKYFCLRLYYNMTETERLKIDSQGCIISFNEDTLLKLFNIGKKVICNLDSTEFITAYYIKDNSEKTEEALKQVDRIMKDKFIMIEVDEELHCGIPTEKDPHLLTESEIYDIIELELGLTKDQIKHFYNYF